MTAGCVILINGASSAGKSTLAKALQATLRDPFWHYSIDHYRDAGILPMARIRSGEFDWRQLRPAFFAGFQASIVALVNAGNNLIVEHIVESEDHRRSLIRCLNGIDVFFVGLHCPLPELERRERLRGDRRIGDAQTDFDTVHAGCVYDLELESTHDVADNAAMLAQAWLKRSSPNGFDKMGRKLGH